VPIAAEGLSTRRKRLSVRRPLVTFIIGFHLLDGLVLCADSEESDTVNKTYVDKLFPLDVEENWRLCFGGSGDAVAIDKFKAKLSPLPSDQGKRELVVERVLGHIKRIYKGLRFNILLGEVDTERQQTFLYRTHDEDVRLRPIDPGNFACIGMETSLAQFLVGNTFDYLMGIDEAMRLGIWATALMKIHTSYVSGRRWPFHTRKVNRSGNAITGRR
jgi:20S proteasome alpha/beta subunit